MIRALMLLVLAGGLSSCGVGFQKEWNKAAGAASDGLSGRWSGTWKSDVNGHNGRLRCVVAEGPAQGTRTFLYRAHWMKILSATLSTEKRVKKTGEGWQFSGGKDLGRFGKFQCDGTVKGDTFSSSYKSELDHGTFTMRREK